MKDCMVHLLCHYDYCHPLFLSIVVYPLELEAIVNEMATFLAIIAFEGTIFNDVTPFLTSFTIFFCIEVSLEPSLVASF